MSTDDFLDKDYIKKEQMLKREKKIREICGLVGIDSPLLNTKEVCDVLKVSVGALRKLGIRTIIIGSPSVSEKKRTRGMIRYMAKDIQDYIFSRIEMR